VEISEIFNVDFRLQTLRALCWVGLQMTRFSHWLLGAIFVGIIALVSVDSGMAQESGAQVAPGTEAPSPSGTITQQGTGVFRAAIR
jgi:hypothetical protein